MIIGHIFSDRRTLIIFVTIILLFHILMRQYYYYESPLGILCFVSENNAIVKISSGKCKEEGVCEETEVIRMANSQIQEYLQGRRTGFDFPMNPQGTDFQKKVWQALCAIPYGETQSYKQLAESIHNPNACRAVGMANNKNPILIAIPCHRIIGANGQLTGYAAGLDKKEYLLQLEKKR